MLLLFLVCNPLVEDISIVINQPSPPSHLPKGPAADQIAGHRPFLRHWYHVGATGTLIGTAATDDTAWPVPCPLPFPPVHSWARRPTSLPDSRCRVHRRTPIPLSRRRHCDCAYPPTRKRQRGPRRLIATLRTACRRRLSVYVYPQTRNSQWVGRGTAPSTRAVPSPRPRRRSVCAYQATRRPDRQRDSIPLITASGTPCRQCHLASIYWTQNRC